MFILIILGLLILGALSTRYKIIDLFVASVWLCIYGFVGIFFNDIYPDAPTTGSAYVYSDGREGWFDVHIMISWIMEKGSLFAQTIMFSPVIYLGSKACVQIYRVIGILVKSSASKTYPKDV